MTVEVLVEVVEESASERAALRSIAEADQVVEDGSGRTVKQVRVEESDGVWGDPVLVSRGAIRVVTCRRPACLGLPSC
ncbi:hypothetical protein AB0I60_05605 [Actinosynnema sp. NPDC050436]|uniref:hypothetical protein n=1 Tax=Actinosynnema sp. NPDC050436 TaxID=3155659 RepID=UPI0033E4087C